MNRKKILGNAMLITTSIVWGVAFVFQRTGMENIGPLTFNAGRMFFAAIALFIVSSITSNTKAAKEAAKIMSKEEIEAKKRTTLKGGIIAGCFMFVAMFFQQAGLLYTTAGKAGFITSLYILIVPILTGILYKKKNSLLVWFGVALGCAGLYLLSITEEFTIAWGDTLVIICALFFSLHIIVVDRFVNRVDVVKMSFYQFAVCLILSSVSAIIFEEPTVSGMLSAIVPILYTGVISGGLGYTFQMLGQKDTDPVVASLILSMEAVVGVIAGWAMLNETMTPREITGCVIMFAAIVLVQLPIGHKGTKQEI